jgi:hypothetical protein
MFSAVTAAPTTAAPDESVTWPEIDPVEIAFCARATEQVRIIAMDEILMKQRLLIIDSSSSVTRIKTSNPLLQPAAFIHLAI